MEERSEFDVLILGGGPAGLSAALWRAELGLTSIVLEKNARPGGQLHWIHTPILNYPGIECNNGADFLDRLLDQLGKRKVEIRTGANLTSVDLAKKQISLSGGELLRGKTLIIATGIRRRRLNLAGEKEFSGKGILQTGQTDRDLLKGKRVAVVGGGDAAFENADALSPYADHIYLLHRRSSFSARGSFVDKVRGNPKIEIITGAVVYGFSGKDRLENLEYWEGENIHKSLPIDAVLVRIGVEPNSEFFRENLQLERGYIVVNHLSETSVSGVFAIGDVASPTAPTLASAAGMAATAVKTLRSQLK